MLYQKWCFFLLSLIFSASLSLSFSISVFLSGPLACAIWGLSKGCKAQVEFGQYKEREDAWQDHCQHRPRNPVHTHRCVNLGGQHTRTYEHSWEHIFYVTCLCESHPNKVLACADQNYYARLFKVLGFLWKQCELPHLWHPYVPSPAHFGWWPWRFVKKLKIYYQPFPLIYLLCSIKFSWVKSYFPRLLQKFGRCSLCWREKHIGRKKIKKRWEQ